MLARVHSTPIGSCEETRGSLSARTIFPGTLQDIGNLIFVDMVTVYVGLARGLARFRITMEADVHASASYRSPIGGPNAGALPPRRSFRRGGWSGSVSEQAPAVLRSHAPSDFRLVH